MQCIFFVVFLMVAIRSTKSQIVNSVLQKIFALDPSSPNFEEVKYRLKVICEKKKIYEEDYIKLLKKMEEINLCLGEYINNVRVHEEIAESQKTGSLEVVFKKYCDQYPQMVECFENVTNFLDFCLGEDSNLLYNATLRFVNIFKEYMCFKDGDRVAYFITQGGEECFNEQRENIENCFKKNSELDYSMRPPMEIWYNITQWDHSFCNELSHLRFCFYENLAKCKKSLPANIVDAFLKYLRKMFLCRNETKSKKGTEDLWIRVTIIAVGLAVVALVCYKLAQ